MTNPDDRPDPVTCGGWLPTVEILSLALRAGRRQLGLSQRELAQRAGVSKSAVARIESVQPGLRVETVASALAAVGLRLGVLDDHGGVWSRANTLPADVEEARDEAGRRLPAHLEHRAWSDTTAPPGPVAASSGMQPTFGDAEPYWHWYRRYVRYVKQGGTGFPRPDTRLSYRR